LNFSGLVMIAATVILDERKPHLSLAVGIDCVLDLIGPLR